MEEKKEKSFTDKIKDFADLGNTYDKEEWIKGNGGACALLELGATMGGLLMAAGLAGAGIMLPQEFPQFKDPIVVGGICGAIIPALAAVNMGINMNKPDKEKNSDNIRVMIGNCCQRLVETGLIPARIAAKIPAGLIEAYEAFKKPKAKEPELER
jgi:hypothetical protein